MEFEPLERPLADYQWATQQMLGCPFLTANERAYVTRMADAALISVEEFDKARQLLMQVAPVSIASIITKCRMHNIGREWPNA